MSRPWGALLSTSAHSRSRAVHNKQLRLIAKGFRATAVSAYRIGWRVSPSLITKLFV